MLIKQSLAAPLRNSASGTEDNFSQRDGEDPARLVKSRFQKPTKPHLLPGGSLMPRASDGKSTGPPWFDGKIKAAAASWHPPCWQGL